MTWPPQKEPDPPRRPAHEILAKVVAVCRKRADMVKHARQEKGCARLGRGSVRMALFGLIHDKPKKAKHGSRRRRRWVANAPRYAEALDWYLAQDAVSMLGEIGRFK